MRKIRGPFQCQFANQILPSDQPYPQRIKVDCFVKTRKFDLIDIIAEALKFAVSLSN